MYLGQKTRSPPRAPWVRAAFTCQTGADSSGRIAWCTGLADGRESRPVMIVAARSAENVLFYGIRWTLSLAWGGWWTAGGRSMLRGVPRRAHPTLQRSHIVKPSGNIEMIARQLHAHHANVPAESTPPFACRRTYAPQHLRAAADVHQPTAGNAPASMTHSPEITIPSI